MKIRVGLLGILALTLVAAPAWSAAQSATSKACSAQADAKGLHGADREAFRSTCMQAPSGAATTTAKTSAGTKAAMPATPTKTVKTTTTGAVPSAKAAPSSVSQACSTQADAKGLHGADRDKFRSACMKGGAPATAPIAATSSAMKPAVKAVAPVAAAPAAAAALAGSKAPPSGISKACSAQADAKGLHGTERESFRAGCMKGAAPAAAAAAVKPAASVAAAPAAKAVAPTAPVVETASPGKPLTTAQHASNARIKDCGAQWTATKNAGKIPAGQTWPQYWSACSKRMKAAGH